MLNNVSYNVVEFAKSQVRKWKHCFSLVLQYVEFTCLVERELGGSWISILTWRSEFFLSFLVIEFSFFQIIEILMQTSNTRKLLIILRVYFLKKLCHCFNGSVKITDNDPVLKKLAFEWYFLGWRSYYISPFDKTEIMWRNFYFCPSSGRMDEWQGHEVFWNWSNEPLSIQVCTPCSWA